MNTTQQEDEDATPSIGESVTKEDSSSCGIPEG
jgi:hypothetical protein